MASRRAQIVIDILTGNAEANVKNLREALQVLSSSSEKELEELNAEVAELGQQMGEAAERGEAAAHGIDVAGQSTRNLNRATSNANQLLFTAGDAVQDIGVAFQHGADTGRALGNAARFAGNNIAFGAEQAALLAATAQREGVSAMQALATSIMGAGGVIIGIQLAVSVLPQLIDLLSSAGREAEQFRETLQEISIIEIENPLEDFQLSLTANDFESSLENLDSARESLENMQRLLERLRQRAETPQGVFTAPQGVDLTTASIILRVSEERLENALRSQDAAESLLTTLEEQGRAEEGITRLLAANEDVRTDIEERQEHALALANEVTAARQAGVGSDTEQARLADEQVEALTEQMAALDSIATVESQLKTLLDEELITAEQALEVYTEILDRREQASRLPPPLPQGSDVDADRETLLERVGERFAARAPRGLVLGGSPPGPEDFAPDPSAFDETVSKLRQLEIATEQGILKPFEAAQQRAAALQQGLMDMIAGGVDPSSMAFQILAEQLDLTQEEIEELQEEVDNTSAVMESQMITSANRVGQALIEAFRGGKEEGEQLLRTVISVATRLGASAIGGPGGAAFSLVGGLFQGAFAHGTSHFPGGVGLVGERGPELVELPRGSQIHSTQDTGRIFEQQASAQAQQTEALRREVQGLRQALYESPPQINLDPLDFTEGLRDRGAL